MFLSVCMALQWTSEPHLYFEVADMGSRYPLTLNPTKQEALASIASQPTEFPLPPMWIWANAGGATTETEKKETIQGPYFLITFKPCGSPGLADQVY